MTIIYYVLLVLGRLNDGILVNNHYLIFVHTGGTSINVNAYQWQVPYPVHTIG